MTGRLFLAFDRDARPLHCSVMLGGAGWVGEVIIDRAHPVARRTDDPTKFGFDEYKRISGGMRCQILGTAEETADGLQTRLMALVSRIC